MKSSTYYFHIETKILADFQICISAPLIADGKENQKTGNYTIIEFTGSYAILCYWTKNTAVFS